MTRGNGRILFGLILLIIGIGFLLQQLLPSFSFNYVWPIIIIAIGLFLIFRRKDQK